MAKRVVITGAGGFIGFHLGRFLRRKGDWVRGVDLKKPEFGAPQADEFLVRDLRQASACLEVTSEVDEVYALAADMGGMGFISSNHADILRNNLLIDVHTLDACRQNRVRRVFYSSSACVYPVFKQSEEKIVPLREEDAFPAQPQDAYGWEKLTTEILAGHFQNDYGLEMRLARFHNIFGPQGTWEGGREKAPAAICRKVALAKLDGHHEIEIWGDGEQTRSFCYVEDCLEGIDQLMRSDVRQPLNIGQDRRVRINELVDMVAEIAGIDVRKRHIPGPQGVRGRNSDNSKVGELLGWSPRISLEEGLTRTYRWIEEELRKRRARSPQSNLEGTGEKPA